MELTTLSGTIFCGSAWNWINIEVIGISKEECLAAFLQECTAIKLERSSSKVPAKVFDEQFKIDIIDWKNSHPELNANSMWVNVDFELFKENPEKYIDLTWDVQKLPIVIVK